MFAHGYLNTAFLLVALLLIAPACSAPSPDEAQQVQTIALLRSVAGPDPSGIEAFREELAGNGFVEGQNLEILGAGEDELYPDPEQARAAVRRWLDRGVDLIVAQSTAGARIAADTAPDTNVLFLSNDPTLAGLVTDELSPDGRLTGVTYRVPEDRTLMLAGRIMPGLNRIGLPYPPEDPAALTHRQSVAAEAASQDLELLAEEFAGEEDLSRAVAELSSQGADLLLLSVSPTATRAVPTLVEAASREGIPIAANIDIAEDALLTLYPDSQALNEQLARQAVRLLNGASPSSVPVENPRRFVFTLNERVASRYGIELPADVVREADLVLR